jgi:hypothetical protein
MKIKNGKSVRLIKGERLTVGKGYQKGRLIKEIQ